MGYTIRIPNGILSMAYTDFNCPNCNCIHTEDDYYKKMERSKYGVAYIKCKVCGIKLGVTTDLKGDVVCFLK